MIISERPILFGNVTARLNCIPPYFLSRSRLTKDPDLLCGGGRHIWARGIDRHAPRRGRYHEVHVFHRHRAEQGFVAQHERAGEAATVAEMHFDRADVSAEMPDSVRRGDFAFFEALELQLTF